MGFHALGIGFTIKKSKNQMGWGFGIWPKFVPENWEKRET